MSTRSATVDNAGWDVDVSNEQGLAAARAGWSNGGQSHTGSIDPDLDRLTRALGWFSIGLGVAQIVAPQRMAQIVGFAEDDTNVPLFRAVGVREIASGVGILTQSNPSSWLWARVGGDAMDLALLTKAMGTDHADRGRIAAATAAVVGVTAIDALAGMRHSRDLNGSTSLDERPAPSEPRVASAITVNAPIAEVFAAWNGFRDLPRFMTDFATVEVRNDRQSHWEATLPAGMSFGWDVTITESKANERIVWTSDEGSGIEASGEVRFNRAPGDRGTEIMFDARFNPPGGEIGNKIAGLFSDPLGVKVNNDLRHAKQLIELGEIVKSDDTMVKGPNPARPIGDMRVT
ncbi:MAG: SRPBCC domain-containing protein [Chloroflexia bacterium]|nr:SRPBCC domain-containing protein [Chloroflexia bacterium]